MQSPPPHQKTCSQQNKGGEVYTNCGGGALDLNQPGRGSTFLALSKDAAAALNAVMLPLQSPSLIPIHQLISHELHWWVSTQMGRPKCVPLYFEEYCYNQASPAAPLATVNYQQLGLSRQHGTGHQHSTCLCIYLSILTDFKPQESSFDFTVHWSLRLRGGRPIFQPKPL